MKIAFYTANIGENVNQLVDDLHHYESGIDYLYFTDNKNVTSKKWNVIHVNNCFDNTRISPGSRILAKRIKMLYWEYFKGYDWVIWVDAHHVISPSSDSNSIKNYIKGITDDIDIVFKKHTGLMPMFDKHGNPIGDKLIRKYDLYDEITHIKYHPDASLENKAILKMWEQHLLSKGFPKKSGLIETNKIIWRVNYKHIDREFNKIWFRCSTEKFRRDQLTINFLIWRDENISDHVKIDYLDTIIPTERQLQSKKTERGLNEWMGNWSV